MKIRRLEVALVIRLIMIMMSALIPLGFTASTASAARNWECDELTEYTEIASGAMPDDNRGFELFEEFADSDDALESMRPFEIRYLSEFLDDWAENLDETKTRDVPRAAREFHKAFVQTLSMWAGLTYDVSSGEDFLEALWDNDIDQAYWAYERADKLGFERCGQVWNDVFNADEDKNEGENEDDDGPGDVDINFL
jgi:hypothetical protein